MTANYSFSTPKEQKLRASLNVLITASSLTKNLMANDNI